MKYFFLMFFLVSSFFTFTVNATPQSTLVIVNDNSYDSPQVGAYYAQKRGIPDENIVHIQARADFYTDWKDFVSIRDQIIRFMQNHMYTTSAITPLVCDTPAPDTKYYCLKTVEQLREHTIFKYIVTTRGVPTRMFVDGTTFLKPEQTSLDNYLRHWLINYYTEDTKFSNLRRAESFGDGRGMRTVIPADDYELIIGRIDGLNLQSALNLVDRAITAENNGVFGKLYGSKFDSSATLHWKNYESGSYVNGNNQNIWRYQHGLFGDLFSPQGNGVRYTYDPVCETHIDKPADIPESGGESPRECSVRLTDGSDNPPGTEGSRQPDPHQALVYLGSHDGHQTSGSFEDFTNWRVNQDSSICEPLCRHTLYPESCRAASTDALKEINTACMGVADGFIGYNFVSYPVSFMSVWPTGWYNSVSDNEAHWNDHDREDQWGWVKYMALPRVVNNDGANGDGFSVWFGNTDQINIPKCYSNTELTITENCYEKKIIYLTNRASFPAVTFDPAIPQKYRIQFKYKSSNIIDPPPELNLMVFLHEPGLADFQVPYKDLVLRETGIEASVGDDNGWIQVETVFEINKVKHDDARINCLIDTTCEIDTGFLNTPWSNQYDGIKIRVESNTNTPFSGNMGIDDFSITEVTTNTPIILKNASFDQGHEQVASGDHAANFLSRLNGTAFWGSVGHHGTNGYSFSHHIMETLIYFMRGLPLGDAVWFAEEFNSGILYGDPLYSPMAIKWNYLENNPGDRINGFSIFWADTINGRDTSLVSTDYQVDFCIGKDFYFCDTNNSWISTGLSGTGGELNQKLGFVLLFNHIDYGDYTLRLAVTSHNIPLDKTQTFYDYYPVVIGYSEEEIPEYSISGFVKNTNGQALEDVKLVVTNINDSTLAFNIQTDINGFYEQTGLRTGNYYVRPTKPGYNIQAVTGNVFQEIIDTNVKDKDFTAIVQDQYIAGTILNTDGQPVPNVSVTVNDNAVFSKTVSTNAEGYFQVAGLINNTYTVTPVLQNYSFSSVSSWDFEIRNNENIDSMDFTANPLGVFFSGTILDVNNNPMAGVDVTMDGFLIQTNVNGFFRFNSVSEDSHNVLATKSGYRIIFNIGNAINVVSRPGIANRDMTATKDFTDYFIAGYILQNGFPLEGVNVQIVGKLGVNTNVTTDSTGFYKQTGLQPDEYFVYPTKADYTFTSKTGETTRRIEGSDIIEYDFIGKKTIKNKLRLKNK